MLYREIMAVCCEIHTKHINTLCGQNVELLNVQMVVRIVTTGLWGNILYKDIITLISDHTAFKAVKATAELNCSFDLPL